MDIDAMTRAVFGRRRFLQIGGLTIATAAVVAACGNDDDGAGTAATSTTRANNQRDVLILRTATSLELLAVDVYQRAIDSNLVTTPAVAETAKLFQQQHKEHADLFAGATTKAGGQAFTAANPVVAQALAPRIAALGSEADVIRLAYDVENVAAATYQSTAGEFVDRNLNVAALSVGGAEARHAAVLGRLVDLPQFPPSGFQALDGAVAAGTGV